MDKTVLATFARYMLCPESVRLSSDTQSLGGAGLEDYKKYPYRHNSLCYSGGSEASPEVLLANIMEALRENKSRKKPLLLLSDGKDSMGIALAYSKMGVSIDTLTLLRRDDSELLAFVKGASESLGHRAHFIEVDDIFKKFNFEVFKKACSHMPNPVLDQGLLYFLFGLKSFFDANGFDPEEYIVVDGLGNDETFGYLPSLPQLRAFKLSALGAWKLIPDSMRALRWFVRSPSEAHGDLSALSCYFNISGGFDLNSYFSSIPRPRNNIEFVDFRAFSRGAFHDHQCMMGKTIASANSLGTEVFFPWVQPNLAHYIFNLPLEYKFDFENLRNKLLLRQLLSESIGWEQKKRGVDLYFDLNCFDFRRNCMEGFIPEVLIKQLFRGSILPDYVRKRACLELLNFTGYCYSRNMSDAEIMGVLGL